MISRRFLCLFLLVPGVRTVHAQEGNTPPAQGIIYTLANDTLYTNAGFQIFVGQQIIIGKGSGQNGWYQSIGFRSGAAWPLLLFYNTELKVTYNEPDGTQIRENDKVKESLYPDATAT